MRLRSWGYEKVRSNPYPEERRRIVIGTEHGHSEEHAKEYSEKRSEKKRSFSVREVFRQGRTEQAEGTEEKKEQGQGEAAELLHRLIVQAYRHRASDIHLEPFAHETVVRLRIDGRMVHFASLRASLHPSLIVRLKILGKMNIAERRIPQDGHVRMEVEHEGLNLRISTMPTVFGEKAVVRLLSETYVIEDADTFGMRGENYRRFRRMLSAPNGLIYLTGPTGSGKTTTMYLALEELSRLPVNVMTIEDPVEKNLSGISQCQVNPQAGMTFARGLRGILRQDPDVIMVGETRDAETAEISVRAAITGHLVLSTLHTNEAAGAITRLKDMGTEPYLLADALTGIVAQRLLRRLCPDCAETAEAGGAVRKRLGRPIETIRVPSGCPACRNLGYRGRIAVHEVLLVDPNIREMIVRGAGLEEIRSYAVQEQKMQTLKEGAADLVEEGITSMEEAERVMYAWE